jgi:GTPase SAR1 family protein
LRKKKQRKDKTRRNDGEYLRIYTQHLEKKVRNVETEKQLLDAEALRLKQELLSLRKEDDGNRNVEIRNKQNGNSKISNLHEGDRGNEKKIQEPTEILLKWYELHSGGGDPVKVAGGGEGAGVRGSEYIFKIVVLGMPEKTAFIRKYVSGVFTEDIKMTLGVDFSVKKVEVDGTQITLRIWDFESEDRFRFALPDYIKDTNGVIIMCNVIDPNGFKRLSEYIEIVWDNVGDIPIFLAIPGLPSEAEKRVKPSEKYKLTEITSEIGSNGEYAFKLLTKKILEQIEEKNKA